MASKQAPVGSFLTIDTTQLQALIDALRESGYRTIGPRIADSADCVRRFGHRSTNCPLGYLDRQDGGIYRLEKSEAPVTSIMSSARTR